LTRLSLLKDIRILVLAIWLGAALYFSAVVAPTAFAVLRGFHLPNAGEIAGGIVNRALAVVNVSGFVVSLALLSTALFSKKRRWLLAELVALGLMATATAVGKWIIAAKLHSLRVAMALPIDQIPPSDPRRVAFNNLHGYSVTVLAIAMIAALIAFFVITYRARSR
jgi:hypothetical protein